MITRCFFAFLLGCFILYATSSRAAWWWPFGNDGIDYQVKIYGVDGETQHWLSSLKLDQKNDTTPPKNTKELIQEAGALSERLHKALEAKGFYDTVIRQNVQNDDGKYKIIFHITPGPRYFISSVTIRWQDTQIKNIPPSSLRTKPRSPVDVVGIQADAKELLNRIGKDSCLLSLAVDPLLELHGNTHTAEVVFRIAHGPKANFGKTIVTGNKDVHKTVILKSVTWKQGSCYKQDSVDKARNTLVQNQLLSSVRVTPAAVPDRFGEVPITITVKERVPHTITAGANYSTDQGFGVTAGREDRNVFGNGEKLNTDLGLAQQEQFLNDTLRIPYFQRDDQTLVLSAVLKREEQTSYTSNTISPSVTVERKLSPHLNSGLGVAYTLTQTKDTLAGNSNYGLVSVPGFLDYDTRDKPNDARKGLLTHLAVTPYTETFGDGGRFLKTETSIQTYFSNDRLSLKPTLALKGTVGSIIGADGKDVPSDIRFYAGGGGSVRGYAYQSLSPRLNGTPIGGSSLLVGTGELRLRFNDSFGGVAFLDAGNAYDSQLPGGDKLYYGAGVGVRYYTPIGPLRFDVATPLNDQDIGQTGLAFYVSLGQSF